MVIWVTVWSSKGFFHFFASSVTNSEFVKNTYSKKISKSAPKFPTCFSLWSFPIQTYNLRIVSYSMVSNYFTMQWGNRCGSIEYIILINTASHDKRQHSHGQLPFFTLCWCYPSFLREFQPFFESQLQYHLLSWAFSVFSQTRIDVAFFWISMSLCLQFSHGTKLNVIFDTSFRSWDSNAHFCPLSLLCWP